MGVTFKPVINRKGIKNKSGLYSISIRVTIDRTTNYFNPKLPKVGLDSWSGRQNKWIKESHPGSFEINSLLQRKLSELDRFILKNKLNERTVSFDDLKGFYFRKGDGSVFNDFARDYVSALSGLKLNTLKVYSTFLKHLDKFNPSIKFSDLNDELILGFKDYLQSSLGLKGGATKKYFDKFKVICKEAVRNGYLEVNTNPFFYTDLKLKVEKPKRTFLEINEIKAIKELDLSYPLSMHRDHFLFQVYSGMYYKDLKELRKSDLNCNDLGVYIMGKRIKNDNPFIIPIYKFPNAEEIINRYSVDDNDKVFPEAISDQKYNEHLKILAEKAKVKKNITNKVARHTYAQLWMSQGVERQFVSKLLAHSEENTTQHYYDISIHDLNSKIAELNFDNI